MKRLLSKSSVGLISAVVAVSLHALPLEAAEWNWNGYFSWFFSGDSRSDSKSAFDQFGLALIPKVALNDQIDIYSQIVFEHALFYSIGVDDSGGRSVDRRSSGELTLNDARLTYRVRDWLNLRAGKFAVPFGLWNTSQYADPVYPSARQPGRESFYSRGSDPWNDNVFFQRYAMGAWVLGRWNAVSYDLYVSNGRTRAAQHSDDNEDKGIGGRLKIDVPAPFLDRMSVMYSGYQDDTSTAAAGTGFMKNQTQAVSFELGLKDFDFHLEYANGTRGPAHMDAFHMMLKYVRFKRAAPFVRYEFFDPDLNKGADRVFVAGGGIQFNLIPGEVFTGTVKLQADRVASEHGNLDAGYASNNYNRFFVGIGAGF